MQDLITNISGFSSPQRLCYSDSTLLLQYKSSRWLYLRMSLCSNELYLLTMKCVISYNAHKIFCLVPFIIFLNVRKEKKNSQLMGCTKTGAGQIRPMGWALPASNPTSSERAYLACGPREHALSKQCGSPQCSGAAGPPAPSLPGAPGGGAYLDGARTGHL